MSDDTSECPFSGANTTKGNTATEEWWPEQLDLRILHQHDRKSNPMGEDFDYASAFNSLDYEELKVGTRCQRGKSVRDVDWTHSLSRWIDRSPMRVKS